MEDMYKSLESLHLKLDKVLAHYKPCNEPQELYKALSQAQGEMGDTEYTGVNKYYYDKYATLSDLCKMSRPALSKHGLAVFQEIYQDEDGRDILKTTLSHISGQSISSKMRIAPNKNTLHQIGSYLSYVRRISYASLVGLLVHDMDDDDGHIAMSLPREEQEKGLKPSLTSSDTNTREYKRITKNELVELERAMGEFHDLGQNICDVYGIEVLADLPSSKYAYVLGQLRKNVALREGKLI